MARASRILVVDDNDSDRHLVREAIMETGWNAIIEEAISNAQAISQLQRLALFNVPPDLILMDYNLVLGTCLAGIRDIRQLAGYAQVPIIVLSTALPPEPIREECRQLGVLKVMAKAYDFASLLKTIAVLKELLEGKGSISRGGSWLNGSTMALQEGD